MFKKVLILSASAGAGHLRAAAAVESALREAGAAEEVVNVDTLQYTNKLFRNLYSKAYIDMVNKAPEVLGWLYDALDKPWKNERRRLALDKLNTRPFVRLLEEQRPDICVCTHFLPAEIISWLKAKGRIATRQAIVVTDFDLHAMWLCHHYEQYFVALEETRAHLERLGVPAGKISVTGIPVDPVFSVEKDRREMRERHGLREGVTTILLSAGGFGVGPVEHIVESLLELKSPAQVVALCGRNEELRRRVERVAAGRRESAPHVTVKAVGYTTEMDEYMAAADILLGKPGGLTTSEALVKGLVFCVVNPIPGQEERNSDHLLEEGVALRCNNLPALAYKLDRLLADPARFSRMRESALRLARPRAAHDIVAKLQALRK
ncbi:MAG TPA: glycosyltransferase [Pyrinomonadaceae bacterium]|jgi:processive 1,2-diacylglycerol beta-glucosyltransferase|nr:glycosyltransferase [Pyrinomonadaceae bacterium]